MFSAASINPALETISYTVDPMRMMFVADILAPRFNSGLQNGEYYVFDNENFLNAPNKLSVLRAPGSEYGRVRSKVADDNFLTREYGLEHPVDDTERAKYANSFDADQTAVATTLHKLKLIREEAVRDLALTASLTSSPSTKWNAASGTTIKADVDAAIQAIKLASGITPDSIVIPWKVWKALKRAPEIIESIKYTGGSFSGVVSDQALAAFLEIPNIYVADTIHNTAADGATVSNAFLWDEDVILFVRARNPNDLREPSFLRQFTWASQVGPNGYRVTTYREEKINSDVHRVIMFEDAKITGASLGYRFSNTLA